MSTHMPTREFLTDFLLERIAERPCAERVLLYRALAHETKDQRLSAECLARAAEYEAALKRERQMLLDFRRRNT